MIKIGCGIIQQEDLVMAGESGFDFVELSGKYLVALNKDQYQNLISRLEQSEIQVLGINGYCPREIRIAGPGFDPVAIRQYAARCAKRAAPLGVKFIGIGSPFSRNLPSGYARSKADEELRQFLTITANEFAVYGMTVCLEALAPCYCNYINYLQEAVAIVQAVNSELVRVVVDFYNMEYLKEADLDLRPFMDWISHAHISDDDGDPFQRSFLEKSKTELHQRRIRNLYQAGYQGAVTIEVDCPFDRQKAEASLHVLRDGSVKDGRR